MPEPPRDQDRRDPLGAGDAASYAAVALDNIDREFPYAYSTVMSSPGDFPQRPRDASPIFFGSFDWHSCVEMHWVLVRLLRLAPRDVPADRVRSRLDTVLTPANGAAEADFVSRPAGRSPYGWAWALELVAELEAWEDADGSRWASALRPLADRLAGLVGSWLARSTYPIRSGLHANSAFACSRALRHARRAAAVGSPGLLEAIESAAARWYFDDVDAPAAYEPSGSDFLSPVLAEAELVGSLLAPERFPGWLDRFLPDLGDGLPGGLAEPAVVSDPTDGQVAHLHGLNLSRAWAMRRVAAMLPPADRRGEVLRRGASAHAAASLDHVVGDDYMVGHWLVAYAVLLRTS